MLIHDSDETTLCPCCGEPLPLGLFAQEPRVLMPQQVMEMNRAGEPIQQAESDDILAAAGRYFLACRATLPLDWDASPLTAGLWVEVNQEDCEYADAFMNGIVETFSAPARLACDFPGFPGSLGAAVQIRSEPGQKRLRLIACEDTRVRSAGQDYKHSDLVWLYRRIWGGTGEAIDAHPQLRHEVNRTWQELIGRPTYRKKVEPPPRYAGIRPAEVVIGPPVDTGEPVAVATLGMAEANPQSAIELATFAREASDGFLNSFAEFCYFTRSGKVIEQGAVITERVSIPDTAGMTGWFIWEPWWINWESPLEVAAGKVDMLAAIPVHSVEQEWARRHGAQALASALEDSHVDITDLQRDPIVVHGEPAS